MSKSSIIFTISVLLLFLYLYDTGRWAAIVAAFESGAVPPASISGVQASTTSGQASTGTGKGSDKFSETGSTVGSTIGTAYGGPVGGAIGGALGGIFGGIFGF
ncbi:MAG: hypothetical protein QXZ36_03675 [Thermoproteota archaeon]